MGGSCWGGSVVKAPVLGRNLHCANRRRSGTLRTNRSRRAGGWRVRQERLRSGLIPGTSVTFISVAIRDTFSLEEIVMVRGLFGGLGEAPVGFVLAGTVAGLMLLGAPTSAL